MKKGYLKIFTFTFLTFLLTNISFSLSQLPTNAFLQYGDNEQSVLILQQILNSDPETKVTDSGVGSPGKETWLFGVLTENALIKFQSKYDLEQTGKIDIKTLKKLNEYVDNYNKPTKKIITNKLKNTTQSNSNTNNSTKQKEEKNPYLSDEENPYFSSNSDSIVSSTSSQTKTYLDSILEKYSNLFSRPATPSTSEIQTSPTYSNTTPYYNPSTGSYQSMPVNTQTSAPQFATTPQASNPGFSVMNAPGQYLSGLPFGNTGGGLTPYSSNFGYQGPTPMNQSNYNGSFGGPLNKNLKEAGDGWLSGPTTHFGTEWNGARDATAGSNCNAAMNSSLNICNPQTCIVALPIAAQVYFWGNEQQKNKMRSLIGMSAGAQYKALGWSYSNIKGSPIEIVNTSNNNCTVAPLWDTGPGDSEGGGIDLTPCIKKVIGNSSRFISKFRPVKAGQKGCEGYNYIKSTVLQNK